MYVCRPNWKFARNSKTLGKSLAQAENIRRAQAFPGQERWCRPAGRSNQWRGTTWSRSVIPLPVMSSSPIELKGTQVGVRYSLSRATQHTAVFCVCGHAMPMLLYYTLWSVLLASVDTTPLQSVRLTSLTPAWPLSAICIINNININIQVVRFIHKLHFNNSIRSQQK